LSRKKQYEQARLQVAPLGFARTWMRGGTGVWGIGGLLFADDP
jgi:hypothetical protein